ncbi:MAG TPA: anaerobic glycerol-3-phosphate dehydrogenase subunit A [Chloroflexi bacterium]|nr:anaerobic glycerol-3-phosphate dehydrogenase subunit A [Chloroflexota bacterium]
MKKLTTDILVIGGGSTGTGVAWDAALRGFRVVLVEKRDLTHGTTGRYHGLLHSGGRYAVKDPQSAIECIEENRILRRTHTHCIEDTSGFFVVTPEDEGDYPDRFKVACAKVGIPCEEIPVKEALRREPLLNPRISRVFEVPDGSADSFLATHVTAQAAQQAGAQILVYHEVIGLLTEGGDGARRVTGARVRDVVGGEEVQIEAAMTINASGAWAGKIAALADIPVRVIPGKGVMVAVNHRLVNTVINRCKMPADGDILVPVHTVAIIGTTDERVSDPEMLSIEPWEVELMLAEGDKLTPGLSQSRILRAWAGVRPLYQEGYSGESRDATRALALLDHQARDGVAGFLTITGGKWTTFRLMAEKTMDKACAQLGVERACRTAETPVPGVEQGYYWLGHRLHEVEEARLQGDLVCECELVTRAMLEQAAVNNPTVTLDDLRRDVRLGMGPCQGGFCTFRAAGILQELRMQAPTASALQDAAPDWSVAYMQSPRHNAHPRPAAPKAGKSSLDNPNLLLRDFLQERWRGLTPVLWGRQLKQERLDELIYLGIMNIDHLPPDNDASPLTDFWEFDTTPGAQERREARDEEQISTLQSPSSSNRKD